MHAAFAAISAVPNLRRNLRSLKTHDDHFQCTRYVPRASGTAVIALTREVGKNEKLANALSGISPTVELPCVSTVQIEKGITELTEALSRQPDDSWLIVTSPESARIVIRCWKNAGKPLLRNVCSIGSGTSELFVRNSISIAFTPTISTFKELARQLPLSSALTKVVYPVSSKASQKNVQLLVDRGFGVQRIDTYTTETRQHSAEELKADVDVVTFASPTTVRGWCANRGMREDLPVACIGETSAAAARKAGFAHVFYPDKPGIRGWVNAIEDAKVMVRERKESMT